MHMRLKYDFYFHKLQVDKIEGFRKENTGSTQSDTGSQIKFISVPICMHRSQHFEMFDRTKSRGCGYFIFSEDLCP